MQSSQTKIRRSLANVRLTRMAAAASLLLLCASQTAYALTAAGTQISNQASATYTDSGLAQRNVTSNTVVTVVQQVASLTLASNGAKSAAPGTLVSYAHTLTNTGNGADSFVLTAAN